MSERYDRLLIFHYMLETSHSFETALKTAKKEIRVLSFQNKYKRDKFINIINELIEADSDSSSSSSDSDDDKIQINMLKRAEEIYNQDKVVEQIPTPPTDFPPVNRRRRRGPPLYRGEPKSSIDRFFDFNQDERKPRGATLRSTVPEEGLPKYTE